MKHLRARLEVDLIQQADTVTLGLQLSREGLIIRWMLICHQVILDIISWCSNMRWTSCNPCSISPRTIRIISSRIQFHFTIFRHYYLREEHRDEPFTLIVRTTIRKIILFIICYIRLFYPIKFYTLPVVVIIPISVFSILRFTSPFHIFRYNFH
ncbi:unknown [Parabacteroides sp. CAG:409]|nr:unknown [Parabacteroides sp. CAG:409]